MNEINYPSDELTDDFLHAQADLGERLLHEKDFQYRPTQNEMKKLALEGMSFLFIDCLRAKWVGFMRRMRSSSFGIRWRFNHTTVT